MLRVLVVAAVALVVAGCGATVGRTPGAARTTVPHTERIVILGLAGAKGPPFREPESVDSGDVPVPDVAGESWTEANAAVTAVGLVAAQNPVLCHSHTTAVRAEVERTVPGAGTSVAPGTLVVFC
jgi:PASTA domain